MIKSINLDNGITLVAEELTHVNSVAIGIWVRTGSVNEDVKYGGISHFVEHMMFKGTSNRSAKEIAYDIDKLGGQINAFTSKESTCYYVKTLSETYKEACDVLIDMMENSLFDQQELERERLVIFEEMKMNLDDPQDLSIETVTDGIFGDSPLGASIIGTRESLNSVDSSIMREYVNNQYTKDSIVISVAGKFNTEEMVDYFNKAFKNHLERKEKVDTNPGEYKKFVKTIKKDIEQSHIAIAKRSFGLEDDDIYSLQIINNFLGGSMSSRLFQNVREQKGLAYSVYSMFSPYASEGYFSIYAGVSHDKIEAALLGIKEELNRLDGEVVSDEEINSSKAQLKSSLVFGQENISVRMFKNGKSRLLLGRNFEQEDILMKIDEVTSEDIERVKKTICDFNEFSGVAVSGIEVDLESIMRS